MKASKESSRFRRFMKVPIRILIKARDFYIQSMTECSGKLDYGMGMGCPTQIPITLPRSFSTSSTKSSSSQNNNEDYRELLKAASTRGSLGNNKTGHQLNLAPPKLQQPNTTMMPRSRSVAIGRIDEDKPCEFDQEDVMVKTDVYARSRSHAVSRRTIMP